MSNGWKKPRLKSGPADRKGGWSYGAMPNERSISADGSNSQFALLALYEAGRAAESGQISVTIHRDTWERVRTYWINNQIEDGPSGQDGSWGYYKPMEGTGSMTCAGIASMVISGDVLHEPDAKVSGDEIDACYRAPSEDQDRIERGIDWLRRKFSVHANPPSRIRRRPLALLLSLWAGACRTAHRAAQDRRVRLVSRRGQLPGQAGHRHEKFMARQRPRRGQRRHRHQPGFAVPLQGTLARAHGQGAIRPADPPAAQGPRLEPPPQRRQEPDDVRRVEVAAGTDLAGDRPPEGQGRRPLAGARAVLLRGRQSLAGEQGRSARALAANLRDYVDRGGFIFADGEGCSSDFDQGFRKLMDLVFQKPEYRFKPLDASHPIWIADQKIPPEQVRLLLGIDYGCRTSVVYAPCNPPGDPKPSLACLWELSRGGQKDHYRPSVQEKIQGGLAIGINVLAYATNREFKEKDLIPETVVPKGLLDKVDRGKFAVAKLRHPGGCDAAPRALANLMEQAGHELNIRVETHPKLIGMQDPALFDYAMVFMHGRNAFRLTDGERQALREYVQRGGLLFADAICGSEAFGESFRREMSIIFPKNPLENIPPRDPIWTSKYGGSDLKTVMRRDPQPVESGKPLRSALRAVPPELKGVRFGDRYGVIFSEFDLSCALEKHDSLDCRGYTKEDAARIGLNVLRYGMQQ